MKKDTDHAPRELAIDLDEMKAYPLEFAHADFVRFREVLEPDHASAELSGGKSLEEWEFECSKRHLRKELVRESREALLTCIFYHYDNARDWQNEAMSSRTPAARPPLSLIGKLDDLIVQATTEHSHYYVKSVAEEAVAYIRTCYRESVTSRTPVAGEDEIEFTGIGDVTPYGFTMTAKLKDRPSQPQPDADREAREKAANEHGQRVERLRFMNGPMKSSDVGKYSKHDYGCGWDACKRFYFGEG